MEKILYIESKLLIKKNCRLTYTTDQRESAEKIIIVIAAERKKHVEE